MATYTRSNAWNSGGTFANVDLLWYAKGVRAMQALPLDNLNSWWSFAAQHGEYISDAQFPGWGHLPSPPATPTTPVPAQNIQDKYWNQCQHQSWYFLPWHRGYLIALEAQIRAVVVAGGGPSDWALPYWNYFGANESNIPPAFTATKLPDGTPNPLSVKARYGPLGNGTIFVPIPPVSQSVMSNDLYTGSDAKTKKPGFGGPKTGFNHGAGPRRGIPRTWNRLLKRLTQLIHTQRKNVADAPTVSPGRMNYCRELLDHLGFGVVEEGKPWAAK